MMKGHAIEKFEEVWLFVERIGNFDEAMLECTNHALFRLSQKQRKVFTCGELKRFLMQETPLKVGVQHNGNYAVYYKHQERAKMAKIIISFKPAL